MNRSESINELATALAKAQATIEGAHKSKDNPAFRGAKYADLAQCLDAARKALTDNGLCVLQPARSTDAGVEVETMLAHSSGQFISETLTIPLTKKDAHGVGSAITYGRRFGFCAMIGVAQEDDDGNTAAGKAPEPLKKGRADPDRPPARGSATEVTAESYAALTPAAREILQRNADYIAEVWHQKGPVQAYNDLMDLNLDTEGQLAMSWLLDSEIRNGLKREGARRRAMETAKEAA